MQGTTRLVSVTQRGRLKSAPLSRFISMAPSPAARLVDKTEIQLMALPDTNEEDDEDTLPPITYYKSGKVLGELFRGVNETKIWREDILRTVPKGGPSAWDQFLGLITRRIQDLKIPGFRWNTHWDMAWQLRNV
jgi:hypothetical protein